MPHFEHAIVLMIVEAMVVIDARTISSRSDDDCEHVIRDIDPDEPKNMPSVVAFE